LDLVKIVIFVAAFFVLLLLARILSSSSEVHASQLQANQIGSEPVAIVPAVGRQPRRPAVVGSEIEFPVRLPPVRQLEDGTYNRPRIINYFFLKTDLLRGPADPDCLFDELRVETEDPGNRYPLTYVYTVATVSGVRDVMEREKLSSLYLERNPVVIIPRWDLRLILETVMNEIMKSYGGGEDLDTEEQEDEET
jgi:hypothetical protein